MKPLQRVRRRFRIAAPRVDDAALAEVRFERAGMRLSELHDGFEHFLLERAQRRRFSRMQQLPHRL